MKRLGLILLPAVLAAVTLLASATAATDAKRTLCHRTASSKTPYVKVSVSAKQLAAHLKHAPDIYPVPAGGCPKTMLASNGGRAFPVALTGEAESQAGDPVATGTATIRARAGQGQVCYRLSADNLPRATAAHIHKGEAGAAGNVVVALKTPNGAGKSAGCVAVPRPLVAAILASPAGYYVNVHTAEFPAGAIRGQLTGTSQSSFGASFTLALKGTTEPNASGSAWLRLRKDAGLVCYRLAVSNVTLPTTGAHIHRGAAGANGAVVVAFTAPGASGGSSGCATATAALIDEILANPAGFYVNVHTTEHPSGAIRAQLG